MKVFDVCVEERQMFCSDDDWKRGKYRVDAENEERAFAEVARYLYKSGYECRSQMVIHRPGALTKHGKRQSQELNHADVRR